MSSATPCIHVVDISILLCDASCFWWQNIRMLTSRKTWYRKKCCSVAGCNNYTAFVTIKLDNAENQSSGWLLRKPTVRAKCMEVGTRINMTQCVNDHSFWGTVCGDTHVCLYNTSDVIYVTHVFCVTLFWSVMCHLPITSPQPLMTKRWLELSDTKCSILWTDYIIVQVNNVHKDIDIYTQPVFRIYFLLYIRIKPFLSG